MSDADLQALRRDVERDGDAASRLRLAAALERTGRPEEALHALLPARDDVAARVEVARLASGIELPLRRMPRLRWSTPPLDPLHRPKLIAVSPLGVVCGLQGPTDIAVLDPDTGKPRWERSWAGGLQCPWPSQVGSALVGVEGTAIVGLDVWTGTELHSAPLLGPILGLRPVGDQLIGWTAEEVWCAPLPDPRDRAEPRRWSTRVALHERASGGPSLVRQGQHLLVRSNDEWPVLEAATGRLAGSLHGEVIHADHAGVLVRDEEGLSHFDDPLRPARWSRRGVWFAAATPEVVALERDEGDDAGLEIVDRLSGAQRDWFSRASFRVRSATADVLYANAINPHDGSLSFGLLGVNGSGGLLWRLDTGTVMDLLPCAPRCLVAATGSAFDDDARIVWIDVIPGLEAAG